MLVPGGATQGPLELVGMGHPIAREYHSAHVRPPCGPHEATMGLQGSHGAPCTPGVPEEDPWGPMRPLGDSMPPNGASWVPHAVDRNYFANEIPQAIDQKYENGQIFKTVKYRLNSKNGSAER